MRILVITAITENGEDLQIVMVTRPETMVSRVVTLIGAAASRSGNPYLVYGDAIEDFTGLDKFDVSITVADCRSGDLEGWS